MTDKQIIIDGIDVSGCVCFAHYHTVANDAGMILFEIENSCTPKQKPCEDIKSCIFKKLTKQLKRKEKECAELEQQYKDLQEDLLNCTACRTTATLKKQLDQLKAENEILKEKLVISFKSDKKTLKIIKALDEIEKYCNRCKQYIEGIANAYVISDIINKAKEGE